MTVEREKYEVDSASWTPLVFPALPQGCRGEPQWVPSYPVEEPSF